MSPTSAGIAVSAALAVVFAAAPSQAAPQALKLTGWDAAAVERAVAGAARRLADQRCQAIFDEFEDADGQPLRSTLDEWNMPPTDYLRLIPFLDGSRRPLCRKGNVALVTEVGVRRIFVCGKVFSAQQLREPGVAESMVIHELLHTLGLGENPPTSIEITRRVEARCR
jgi:hypothetical protein